MNHGEISIAWLSSGSFLRLQPTALKSAVDRDRAPGRFLLTGWRLPGSPGSGQGTFLVDELPPWHSNRLSRLIKTAKLHVVDTGLAAALLGMDATALDRCRSGSCGS